jgi:hypothetical protein
MSKLPSVSSRDAIRVAEKLGFVFDRQKDNPVRVFRPGEAFRDGWDRINLD